MPALFAYIVAVGLLLGGGYGALTWLAAPEPTKLVAKAKPKPPPASEMASRAPDPAEVSNPDNPAAASDSDKAASTPNARATPATADRTATMDAPAKASSPAADQHLRAAHAEVAVQEKPPARDIQQPAKAADMPANLPVASPATAPAAAKAVKRPHLRQASPHPHPERAAGTHRLALMVLRTIEYPDGRRVSQLLPYRARRDALAFGPDE